MHTDHLLYHTFTLAENVLIERKSSLWVAKMVGCLAGKVSSPNSGSFTYSGLGDRYAKLLQYPPTQKCMRNECHLLRSWFPRFFACSFCFGKSYALESHMVDYYLLALLKYWPMPFVLKNLLYRA